MILDKINQPNDIKNIPPEEYPDLAQEIRDLILETVSRNGGHLASNLGVVELTMALHLAFSFPKDKLVWDVGHQSYTHKILTGRRERFHTNRQFKGVAPFPSPMESEYDAFIAGHASNSISAALGMDIGDGILAMGDGQSANGDKAGTRKVVAIIGDGAMTGGLAFEGLNNTSMNKNNLLIVLNDNNMAIDPIKGGFTQYLVDITTSARYNRWRWWGYRLARKLRLINEDNKGRVQRFTNNLKALLTKQGNNIFQGLNLRYFGPADGHDVLNLVRIFREIKDYEGPKVLHIITKKGKGYEPAENDQTTWHAPGEFDVNTGERRKGDEAKRQALWQEVFGEQLLSLAREDEKVVGITPAMPSGCSMNIMQREIPERVFDVGIAEGHAVTFSAGLAKAGMKPFCNIYSSFLQRAYDNIIHDVALPKLPVVFCIDRAGIVGNDGATHHGLLDLAYLRPIPNMVIGAPMTAEDLQQMMVMAKDYDGPIAIRYPRGRTVNAPCPLSTSIEIGKGAALRSGNKVAVLSIGAIGNTVANAINMCYQKMGTDSTFAHYDMRWLKPLDEELLHTIGKQFSRIITVEDGVINGGLGSAVMEWMNDHGYTARITRLGVNDQFVEHGSTNELYHLLKLDKEGICESLLQALEQ
jgi:1-deoxy-D-xylulose-5-phosphate synthase